MNLRSGRKVVHTIANTPSIVNEVKNTVRAVVNDLATISKNPIVREISKVSSYPYSKVFSQPNLRLRQMYRPSTYGKYKKPKSVRYFPRRKQRGKKRVNTAVSSKSAYPSGKRHVIPSRPLLVTDKQQLRMKSMSAAEKSIIGKNQFRFWDNLPRVCRFRDFQYLEPSSGLTQITFPYNNVNTMLSWINLNDSYHPLYDANYGSVTDYNTSCQYAYFSEVYNLLSNHYKYDYVDSGCVTFDLSAPTDNYVSTGYTGSANFAMKDQNSNYVRFWYIIASPATVSTNFNSPVKMKAYPGTKYIDCIRGQHKRFQVNFKTKAYVYTDADNDKYLTELGATPASPTNIVRLYYFIENMDRYDMNNTTIFEKKLAGCQIAVQIHQNHNFITLSQDLIPV